MSTETEPAAGGPEPAPFPPPNEPFPVGHIRKVDAAIGLAEQVMLCLLLVGLVVSALISAVYGNFLNESIGWTAEVIRYAVFYIAMIGAALCAQKARMMAMDVVTRFMNPLQKAASRVVVALFVIFLCYLLVAASRHLAEETASLHEGYDLISPEIGTIALPLGAALIALHYVLHLLIDVRYFAAGKLPPEPPMSAGH